MGWETLKTELAAGRPVMTWGDWEYLPRLRRKLHGFGWEYHFGCLV